MAAGRILILRWAGSAYDSLGGLLELLAQEFAALGHRVLLFTADGADWPQKLAPLVSEGDLACAVSMSGIGIDLTVKDKGPLWQVLQIPFFNWSCDHPCYFPSRHGLRGRFLMHGYVFPDHAHYNIRHLSPNGAAFGVHIGMPPRSLFPGAPLPLAQRNGRLIFSKSGADTNAIEAGWRTRLPILSRLLFEAAEALFHASTLDFVPVLQRLAEPHGLLLDGNGALTVSLIRELDAYIRYRRGNLLMQALRNYPIDVFGAGWDHLSWEGGRTVFHGSQTFRATLERLPGYLGCLSLNPLVEQSLHDRVFFALAAGVVPVSDSNAFSRAHLAALEPYAFGIAPEQMTAAVEAVLADPAAALACTEAGGQALAGRFTMRHAAQQILEFVALHDVNARVSA
jgi:hypothetical protein